LKPDHGYEASQGEDQRGYWLVWDKIRENVYLLKLDERVRSFIGADKREYILLEARSEGMKLHRGKIRQNIGSFGTRSERMYTSCSKIRGNKGSYGADQSKYILLEPDQNA
jgi:hypothetical protein